MTIEDPASGSYHLDKRIPVAMVLALVVQTSGIIWWAATLAAVQEQSLVDQRRMELRLERVETQRDDLSNRVIRIEEKISGQGDTLREILRYVQPASPGGRP